MPNIDKLKGKLVEKRLTYMDCAEELGISKTTFTSKMNNRTGFGVTEAAKLSDFLKLTQEEMLSIFFGN